MVFLIQNTQNRDARVVSLKLDELLRALHGARTGMVKLDHMSDEELEHIQAQFEGLDEKFSTLVQDDIEHVRRELKVRRQEANPQQPGANETNLREKTSVWCPFTLRNCRTRPVKYTPQFSCA